ncbi:nuclear RNA export factor 2-like isoform X2 [Echinops telfairi]|uniref:Nuclear RNA export factor 2-like isoform X2 n=1 Tax=Echinops telfairi TaxID=9371 RepID=A0AC55D463_ECHTE|nr:nuclear RNA export factor 2-like isoform X2 [Echinops telfairi]
MYSTAKNFRTYRTEEYKGGGNTSRGRVNYKSYFHENCGEENVYYKNNGYKSRLSQFQEDDGNTAMSDIQKDLHPRHNLSTTDDNNRKVARDNKDLIHITEWRDGNHQMRNMNKNEPGCKDRTFPMTKNKGPMPKYRTPSKREIEENGQNNIYGNWFKITIPYGRKYTKTWLLNSIQSKCSVHFTPVDFHYVRSQAHFFVKNSTTAFALKNVNYKIHDENNHQVRLFVKESAAPSSEQNKLKPEEIEQLKLAMKKRFDVSQKSLNLQSFRFDQDLMSHDIDMILNRRNCMSATLTVIEENFPELLSLNLCSNKLYQLDGLADIIPKAPQIKILNLSNNELKSLRQLDKIREMKLEELWLQGNPLYNNFSNYSTYMSAILDYFPKLLCLDGKDVTHSMDVETGASEILKPSKKNHGVSEMLKNLVLQFLEQYYSIYDCGDRSRLLDAYHDEACFSLTIPCNPKELVPLSLYKYSKSNRNMKNCKDHVLLTQLLKHTKRDVVDFLRVLPKTQHDLSSFMVDICILTEKMLCFSVNGRFKEVEATCPVILRAFTRIFIVIPASNSRLCIVNDTLTVSNACPKEIQSDVSIPARAPSSIPVPTISQEQQAMVQAFSTQSGMKFNWSLKCLEQNDWNYAVAGQNFTLLKAEGKIPKEAFQQIS